jgi:hypothetical protein
VAEVVAVTVDTDDSFAFGPDRIADTEAIPRFSPENRLREPRDVLTICSGLVSISESTPEGTHEEVELRLAHFSVKEYLVSDRIQKGKASKYSVKKSTDGDIAQACLAYLLYFEEPALVLIDLVGDFGNIEEFPLADYAAQYWTKHARAALKESDSKLVQQLIMELFLVNKYALLNSVRRFDPDDGAPHMKHTFYSIAPPLYYASSAGLLEPVQRLLELGAEVNAQGGEYGNALQAASYGEHLAIVKVLLESGAEVNAQGGYYGNAL